MMKHELHGDLGLLTIEVKGPLTADDFASLTTQVDEFLTDHDELTGVMIVTKDLPDWIGFDAMKSHFRFVRNHHERVRRVAFVTDSAAVAAVEKLAEFLVEAETEVFASTEREKARHWLLEKDA